jgi:ferritin
VITYNSIYEIIQNSVKIIQTNFLRQHANSNMIIMQRMIVFVFNVDESRLGI